MPYSQSSARVAALNRLVTLKSPFTYVRIRTRKIPTNVRDAVFQNCVFQLSSVLEDYIGGVISQWLSRLEVGAARNSTLPNHTRALHIARVQEEMYRRYIGLGNEVEIAEKVLESAASYGLLDDNLRMSEVDFRSRIVKDKKFPSVDNVRVLFRRIGLPNIYAVLSRRTRSGVELSLQAFMDVRNALAHESPPSVTDVDVDRYFGQVSIWIAAIDRELYAHIVRTSGAQYWR